MNSFFLFLSELIVNRILIVFFFNNLDPKTEPINHHY